MFKLSLFVAPLALASRFDIEAQIEAIQNQNVSARNLKPILGPQLAQIDGYGCWCYRRFRISLNPDFYGGKAD